MGKALASARVLRPLTPVSFNQWRAQLTTTCLAGGLESPPRVQVPATRTAQTRVCPPCAMCPKAQGSALAGGRQRDREDQRTAHAIHLRESSADLMPRAIHASSDGTQPIPHPSPPKQRGSDSDPSVSDTRLHPSSHHTQIRLKFSLDVLLP